MQNILPLFDIDIHLDFCQISSLLWSVNEGLFGKLNSRYFAIIASFYERFRSTISAKHSAIFPCSS